MKKAVLVRLVLVAAVLALLPSIASAQLASNEVYANTAFQIAANHDGVNTTEYRLTRNGAAVGTQPRSALAGGVIAFNQPGLAVGSYTFVVTAVGDGGSTPSDPYVVVVVVVPSAPAKPSQLRVVRQ